MDFGDEIAKRLLGGKGGEINPTTERRKTMFKRLVVLCCILLLPTMAAAEGTVNYGDFWVGGQLGAVFTPNTDVTVSPPLFPSFDVSMKTDPGFSAGAIVGYNFCMPYRPAWERFFGVALDFQWNKFNHPGEDFIGGGDFKIKGNQFALSLLGRLQYPLMGSEKFSRGRIVPFLMFGPSVVWTTQEVSDNIFFNGGSETSTNFALVAEVGVEFFICPQLSIGPSFRYRHVFGPNYSIGPIDIDTNLNQFMVLGRLAWHF
jgi:opacity protein-like surface antigen